MNLKADFVIQPPIVFKKYDKDKNKENQEKRVELTPRDPFPKGSVEELKALYNFLKDNEYDYRGFMVERLLAFYDVFEFEKRNVNGENILMYFIRFGEEKHSEWIINFIDIMDEHCPRFLEFLIREKNVFDGYQVLIYTILEGKVDIARRIIQTGYSDYGYMNKRGMTPLFLACLKKEKEIVEMMVSNPDVFNNCNVGRTDINNLNEFWLCCFNNWPELAMKFIDHPNIDISKSSSYGITSFMLCVKKGEELNEIAFEILRRNKANLKVMNTFNQNALHWSCFYSNEEIALAILKYSFIENAETIEQQRLNIGFIRDLLRKEKTDGDTPLILATRNGMKRVVEEILFYMKLEEVMYVNKENESAMTIAQKNNFVEIQELISAKISKSTVLLLKN